MNALSLLSTLALELPNLAVGLLVVLFLFISVVMILIVLIQRPQGGGLSGAFGSSAEGAGQTAFGAKTGDVLTTATIIIFLVFLATAVVLNYAVKPGETSNQATVAADDTAQQEPAPAEGQVVIPVQPGADGTMQPMQSADGTAPASPLRVTNTEGEGAAPIIQPVTDPEILEQLNRGLDPNVLEQVQGGDPEPGDDADPADPPGEEGSDDDGGDETPDDGEGR